MITSKPRSGSENPEKSFFHQAAIKGYETEIANLKKEIEQIQQNTQVSNTFSVLYPLIFLSFIF